MQEYVIVEDVPVFDETKDYDEAVLTQIIEKANKRIYDTNDEVPITLGHTLPPGTPEKDQPEVVGFATNFRLGTIGNLKPRKAIIATFKFFKDKFDLARRFPRRSIELYKDTLEMDPIALLGASVPARNLGVMTFNKDGREKLRFEMYYDLLSQENPTSNSIYSSNMDEKDLVKQVVKFLENSDVFEWAREQMKQQEQEAVAEDEADEEQEDMNNNVNHAEEPMEVREGQEAPDQKDQAQDKGESKDKVRMQRDQAKSELARFQRQHEELKTQFDELVIKFQRAERERDLTRLESEGIAFDLAEELEYVATMPAQQYAKHLDRMQKHYQRTPVGVHLRPAPIAEFGGDQNTFTRDKMLQVVNLATDKHISYEEALDAVKGYKG